MKIAVIGAGLAGVATAHELALAGHDVTVLERHASVAEEASFAPAGIAVPGLAAPWRPLRAAWPRRRAAHLHQLQAGGCSFAQKALTRARRQALATAAEARALAALRLGRCGLERIEAHRHGHGLELEGGQGLVLRVEGSRELAQAEAAVAWLQAQGEPVRWLDGSQLAATEPALQAPGTDVRLVHLPLGHVGNPREWAQLLRAAAQLRGARFLFQQEVLSVQAGSPVRIQHASRPLPAGPREPGEAGGATPAADAGRVQVLEVDAVVLCNGRGAPALLGAGAPALPLLPLRLATVTAPAQQREADTDPAPRAALLDLASGITISRLGGRVRLGSAHEHGTAAAGSPEPGRLQPLYAMLDTHYPGGVHWAQAQVWQTTRCTLADGWPAVGASGLPGIWLNVGHGHAGWLLGQAAAWHLRQQIGGAAAEADCSLWAPQRDLAA